MILVIDNYDSFTYNLVQYMGQLGAEVEVFRNDAITVEGIVERQPKGIMLSPGPCSPDKSGVCLSVLAGAFNDAESSLLSHIPIFGVCLGQQAMGQVAGGNVVRAKTIMHGKTSMIEHDGKGLFAGIPSPFKVVRYHSLVVEASSVPDTFEVTARSLDDGCVMGLRHKSRPIEGVQFHPESVLTEHGMTLLENFVKQTI